MKNLLPMIYCALSLVMMSLSACQSAPDVPDDARLIYYGPVDHPQAMSEMLPEVDDGMPARQIYIYDESEYGVVAVRSIDARHRDLNFNWQSKHHYRIYAD